MSSGKIRHLGRYAATVLLVLAPVMVISVGIITVCRSNALEHGSVAEGDCARAAPRECVRSTIESSRSRDFNGYYYCACVTSNGMSKGFIAADSAAHMVDDPSARPSRSNLGNDNPAVTFPVGAPHR